MTNKLLIPAFGGFAWLLYRTGTDFRTTINIENKDLKTCMFGQIKKYTVSSDKGTLVVGKDFLTLRFKEKEVYEQLNVGQKHYVHGYGLNIPLLHLHKNIYFQNGTPCDLNCHCKEKKTWLSKIMLHN